MEECANLPPEHNLIRLLRFCGHFLYYRIGGKTGRGRILNVLKDHQELLQRELQEILGVQSGSMSEIVIKMEAEDLVEKAKSTKDGRQLVLRLTQKGQEEAARYRTEFERRVSQMTACLSPEELTELIRLLERLQLHWEDLEEQWEIPALPEKMKIRAEQVSHEEFKNS